MGSRLARLSRLATRTAGAAAAAAAVAAGPVAAQEVLLANEALAVRLDPESGAIRQVTDLHHGIDLVATPGLAPPWRLASAAGTTIGSGPVTLTPDAEFDGTAVDLAWPAGPDGLAVRARIEVATGDAPARFVARVESTSGPRIDWLEYPVAGGIGRLGPDPARSELAHPFATGYRIVDPLARLGAGDRLGYYPDAYGGAALQQLSYLERETGGFHLQVEDPTGEAKQLDLWKNGETGLLELTVRRYNPDARDGVGLAPAGAVVLCASRTGTWEEGADLYRAWAVSQPWAARGPRRDWPENERAGWLFERTGAATFGISVRRDMTAWYRGLQDFLRVPLLHISGFWWPGGTFASEWYGGYNDWSDSRVDPVNLQAIREEGDRVALFLFPQHFARGANEYAHPAPDPASDPVAPWSPFAMEPDPESGDWSFICPATAAWQAFYGWRAVRLMELYGADAEYLDIGPGLGRVRCTDAGHGHPPGWGVPLVEGAKAMLDARRVDVHQRKGAFVPRGTELISELYLDRFDFYQARAQAGPLTMLEGDRLREAVKAGWAEKIPLFDFVYHDYGPVRLDGNLKLASELGGTFFWVAARVALDGGLPELNYELSALERLPGMSGRTWFETYRNSYDCADTTPYAAEPGRAAFLRELADLRTRRGPEFLAWGRMRRAPAFSPAPPSVTMNYRLYNTFNRAFTCDLGVEAGPEFFQTGSFTVPSVVASAFSAPAPPPPGDPPRRPVESVGLALAEVSGVARTAGLVLDPARQGVPMLNFRATLRRRTSDADLGVKQAGTVESVALGGREAVLLRLDPAACAGEACRYRVYRAAAPLALREESSLMAETSGHAFDDGEAAMDGRTWFYLVDDGGGWPGDSLRVARGTAIELSW
ncbi:MAG: DUF6259 domain-containing protein [Acidobacteria bacterium]|jgi:hypothetical protein|nr:DUF6259 domain-containing protein [Acidobacteriota bacterium]